MSQWRQRGLGVDVPGTEMTRQSDGVTCTDGYTTPQAGDFALVAEKGGVLEVMGDEFELRLARHMVRFRASHKLTKNKVVGN